MESIQQYKWQDKKVLIIEDDPSSVILLKEIRPVHVIAQSAYALIEDRDRALAAGCDAHLPKPINTFELLGVMHGFLLGTDTLPSI